MSTDVFVRAGVITFPIPATDGGTGQTSYATGDILYASAPNVLSKLPIGTAGQVLTVAGGLPSWASGGGSGDVSGPGSSTNTALARWNGTGGTSLLDSSVTLDGSGNIVGATSVTGSALASGSLSLHSTTHATKGLVKVNDKSIFAIVDPDVAGSEAFIGAPQALQLVTGDGNTYGGFGIYAATSTQFGGANINPITIRGTFATPSPLQTNDVMFAISLYAWDTVTYQPAGYASFTASENHSATNLGNYWQWGTVNTGETTMANRMVLGTGGLYLENGFHFNDRSFSGSKALVSNSQNFFVESSVTSTELGYLSGVTSAVQTQLDGMAKLAGRASGQTLNGGTAASENLVFSSTANSTKGFIRVNDATNVEFADGGIVGLDAFLASNNFYNVNTAYGSGIARAGNLLMHISNDDDGGGAFYGEYFDYISSRGTIASPTFLSQGDILAMHQFLTWDGTSFFGGVASLRVTAAENFSGSALGGKWHFRTNQIGTINTSADRLTITSDAITAFTAVLPGTTSAYALGSASFVWSKVHTGDLLQYGATSGALTQSAAAVTTSYAITWPAAQGAANTFLKNDGSGGLSWGTPATATPTVAGVVTSYFPVVGSSIKSVSSTGYTVLTGDGFQAVEVSTGASDQTVGLPAIASNDGRVITITKTDGAAGFIIVDADGSDSVDGEPTRYIMAAYDSLTLLADANTATWRRLVAAPEYVSNSNNGDTDNTSAFEYGPAGSAGIVATTDLTGDHTKRVRFKSSFLENEKLTLQFKSTASGGEWIDAAESGPLGVQVGPVSQGSTNYGVGFTRVTGSTTDLDVYFAHYASPGALYASTGNGWSTVSAAKWRVVKSRM